MLLLLLYGSSSVCNGIRQAKKRENVVVKHVTFAEVQRSIVASEIL